ncbi:PTS sugar transporter subunit IIC [Mycoplasma sp. NEAQ87857]|uniref:PTS sugar transporter subunit IIC n=1 Tax=Mycoplasma sp. NEAQ87857 TaxID=2683967 RepID=UPI001317D7A0|nr:PTS transporter subunit EIIC [Mycoplasma sp. NEAQ87857]QGZ97520.1 PTS sugar transporter subunit IIC [Mycoplasma sp. NEAQ87857]
MHAKNAFTSGMTKFFQSVEHTFMPIMAKLGNNRYIEAIRNGMISTIPILLIGSTFLFIFFFPIGKNNTLGVNVLLPIQNGRYASLLILPYRLTYPMLGFFAVIGVARSLAKSYKLDDQQAVLIAIIAYLMSIVGPTYKTIGNPSFTTGSFGTATIFGGFVIAIASVEMFRFCIKYKITIRLPKSVPSVVAKPFNALIPMLFVMIPAALIFNLGKFDIHSYMNFLFSPLQSIFAGNNYFGFFVVVVFVMLLWIAGVHGLAVIGSLARPFWLIALAQNQTLQQSLKLSQLYVKDGANIIVEPFFQWFVWIGGAGATFGLIIVMLLIAKSKYIRSVTYPSILPGIFNINEPIIFGYPLVLNPILAIPAILSPLALGTVSFLALKFNIVATPINLVGWTLPTPVGAFLSTGLDWKALVLTFVLMAISALIWLPFAKLYDNKMLKEEIEMVITERIEEAKKANLEYDAKEIREQVTKELKSRSIRNRFKGVSAS